MRVVLHASKEQIKATLESQDVSFFQQMVNEVAAESGKPLDAIAAAVAFMSQEVDRSC